MTSIVFLCSNVTEELAAMTERNLELLKSCAEWSESEIIVVDNASVFGTHALGRVADVLVRNRRNLGFSKGMNQGMKLAGGGKILLVSNDVAVTSKTLKAMLEASERHPNAVIYPSFENKGHQWSDEDYEDDVDGAILLLPKKIFEATDGYDERFSPAYYEDTDWFLRIRQAGFGHVRTGRAVVYHGESQTTQRLGIRNTAFEESRKKFVEKWGFDPTGLTFREVCQRFL